MKYCPGGPKGYVGRSKVSVGSISLCLEFRSHKLVCLSTGLFTPDLLVKLTDHIRSYIHLTISGSWSHIRRTGPHVDWGGPRWKIFLLLMMNSVVIPIFSIFIESLLK